MCGDEHDGRLMRYSKRGYQTLRMLMDPAVPVRGDGAIDLCQTCQRRVWFAGGYISLLANHLIAAARVVENLRRWFLPRLEALEIGGEVTWQHNRERAVRMAKQVAEERCWAIVIKRREYGRLIIQRVPHPSDSDRSPKGGDGEAGSVHEGAGRRHRHD